MYTHITSRFYNISYNTNLYNLLTCQNYDYLQTLLLKPFEHQNKTFTAIQVIFLKFDEPKSNLSNG